MKKIVRQITENEWEQLFSKFPVMLATIVAARIWGCQLDAEEVGDIVSKLNERFWTITVDTLKETASFPEGVSAEKTQV